jgi:hypothetical protein
MRHPRGQVEGVSGLKHPLFARIEALQDTEV